MGLGVELLLVVRSENCLVTTLLQLFVCMDQKLWEPVCKIGHKPVWNGAQTALDVLRKFAIVVLLQ